MPIKGSLATWIPIGLFEPAGQVATYGPRLDYYCHKQFPKQFSVVVMEWKTRQIGPVPQQPASRGCDN
jgi:hypothetical protein